jgi:hypothetical protein
MRARTCLFARHLVFYGFAGIFVKFRQSDALPRWLKNQHLPKIVDVFPGLWQMEEAC